ncbi:glutamyl-tRNA reductase [Arthrobacter sp. B6]|uniref:glutamyl-tRNA reductase n=1 Tax=Arthrobacter sp. B6 TaxID=1570137 RepID=UPI0008304161
MPVGAEKYAAARSAPGGQVFALVASHHGTGLDFLARLGAGPRRITSAALAASPDLAGTVLLSTCNRFEVYFEIAAGTEPSAARGRMLSIISDCSGVPDEELRASLDFLSGQAMTEHLFSVGAGLDSVVVGEREIAGQLRRSLTAAQESGTASGALIRLFQAASRAARDVGSLTTLGDAGRSMVSAALDLAAVKLGSSGVAGLSVVVIGTGAYAGSTLALLAAGHCDNVSVFSWSGRAETFAGARGAAGLSRSELPKAVQGADVVIGCSGRGIRLGADEFRRFRQTGQERLIVVDLALSRDFEPETGELPGVELITLDDVRSASPREHSAVVQEAAEVVRQAALRFEDDQQARLLDPAIVALRGHMQRVLASEVVRVKNQHGCTATAEAVEFALRRMVRQLMHVPTARARELAASGRQGDYTAALEALYGLNVEPAPEQIAASERVDAAQAG